MPGDPPAHRPSASPADHMTGCAVDRPSNRPSECPAFRPGDRATGRSFNGPSDRPSVRPTGAQTGRLSDLVSEGRPINLTGHPSWVSLMSTRPLAVARMRYGLRRGCGRSHGEAAHIHEEGPTARLGSPAGERLGSWCVYVATAVRSAWRRMLHCSIGVPERGLHEFSECRCLPRSGQDPSTTPQFGRVRDDFGQIRTLSAVCPREGRLLLQRPIEDRTHGPNPETLEET